MSARIVVTHPEPDACDQWRDALAARLPAFEVVIDDGTAHPDARYALGWGPPPDFFERAPTLRAFFSAGAGVDHLMTHAALRDGTPLPIYRLEDAGMAEQMAEYCCHEVIRRFRDWAGYERQQADVRWHERPLPDRASFTIGLFGLGTLGMAVARALQGFGYPVSAYTRSARAIDGIDCHHGAGLASFLARCRVLILLAPLTPDTADVVDAALLAKLPPDAYLVNVARGGLVVDRDLLAALDGGRLAGATLDVFRTEPLPPDHRYWSHPRVRLTPHVAAMTLVGPSAAQVADKIRDLEDGRAPSGRVDPGRGY